MDRPRLDGLRIIAAYLKLSMQQTRKLYQLTVPVEDRLPVFTLSASRSKNARLSAFVDELDAWIDRRADRPFEARR
jgi:hypothetical protein